MSQPLDGPRRRLPFAFSELDASVRRDVLYFEASDTAQSSGILYRPPGREPKTAVYLMHPRGAFSRHYVVPGLTARGYAVLGHDSRYLNNDSHMIHERLLLDVAAGMRELKERGFERIVLLGNSGGGSLLGFYQSQAAKEPGERLSSAPGGELADLPGETMPPGDLFIAVAAHPGQGRFMQNVLDPSVVNEADPTSWEPDFDMYSPHNGYRPYPEPSHFETRWLGKYRNRQRDRNRRLDALARGYIEEREYWQERRREPVYGELAPVQRGLVDRRANLSRYMVVYRTLANPAYLDLTIEPNGRPLGSIFATGDPITGNYGQAGLGRLLTPGAWLSTWSGVSSRANLPQTIAGITVPTLLVYADGDSDVFPSEQLEMYNASGADDRDLQVLDWADHYLNPVGEEGRAMADPRERLLEMIVPWIEERIGEP
ncbi:MAG: alpha/beta hydrolase [Dehalococcoidia bacterium]|nr:alpha/beta hydrolase [Dehalococcoidia bacterium]MCB9485377.1 alpha/beta hydrolase [Thermoflexaceae bacterium]